MGRRIDEMFVEGLDGASLRRRRRGQAPQDGACHADRSRGRPWESARSASASVEYSVSDADALESERRPHPDRARHLGAAPQRGVLRSADRFAGERDGGAARHLRAAQPARWSWSTP
jgi:hypothetical protein